MSVKLSDLSNYPDLIESLELILLTEALTGSSYYILDRERHWEVDIRSIKLSLEIPKVNNLYQPPVAQIGTIFITRKLSNTEEFEDEMRKHKIIISKDVTTRIGNGYINMNGSVQVVNNYWRFFFTDHKTLYDFYLICKKYGVL